MKAITSPSVYVVGRQVVDDQVLNKFLADHDVKWESDSEVGAEVLTETAGRVCYMSFAKPRPGGNAAYINHIKEVGHGSVAEHAVWNLIVTGVSRSLTHELVRHRAGFGYSQLSQRYVDESVAEYVVPRELQREVEQALLFKMWCEEYVKERPDAGPEEISETFYKDRPECSPQEIWAGQVWLSAVRYAHTSYVGLANYLNAKLVDADAARRKDQPPDPNATLESASAKYTEIRKGARQAARSVLPNATETKIFVTGNARALRHFIEMRGSRHADPEIRVLATAVLDVLQAESPNWFGDFVREKLPDGTFELTTPHSKI